MPPSARRPRARAAALLLIVATAAAARAATTTTTPAIERVTTIAPFPRGLAMVDGKLHVLCRGRVRGAGGVSAQVLDQAGTIYVVDPAVTEPLDTRPAGIAVRTNGTVLARPTSPPFHLWDRTADPPERDRLTDRPYCTLRWHEATQSFYLCAFSGIDKARTAADPVAFSKNLADAVLRYDLRTGAWHEVERHDLEAGGRYPHHDPARHRPPHGWLNGPDNCLPLGDGLYVVAKDNSRLVRYDLGPLARDPHAGPPPSEIILEDAIAIEGRGVQRYRGHSALAARDGWLYIAYRTSSVIVRVPLDDDGRVRRPTVGQLIARFDPWDPATGRSADLTDLAFDDAGRLYVVSARPARVYRFTPDPDQIFDARAGRIDPWLDLAAAADKPSLKSENILWHAGWLYITSGDGYADAGGATGTVFRVRAGE